MIEKKKDIKTKRMTKILKAFEMIEEKKKEYKSNHIEMID
jgi:hypothetical protein